VAGLAPRTGFEAVSTLQALKKITEKIERSSKNCEFTINMASMRNYALEYMLSLKNRPQDMLA